MSIDPYFKSGLSPYMNERQFQGVGIPLNINTAIGFPLGGNVVIKWLEDGTVNWPSILIYAHGTWGGPSIDHVPMAVLYAGSPVANITVPVKEFLTKNNSKETVNALGTIAYVTADQRYWTNVGLVKDHYNRWVPLVTKVNLGLVNVYNGEPNVPPGGIQATKYSATIAQSDINYVAETFGAYDNKKQKYFSLPLLQPTAYYSLCWEQNGLHDPDYDAIFYIQPAGFREYDEIPDRTELNTRVAGEKGLYEDEFLTAGQVEAGTNVTLRWRNIDGSLTGYPTVASKGGNLVIEATGGGGGNTRHQGAYYPFNQGNLYYDETTSIIRFQDEPQDYPDSMVAIPKTTLPIYFDLFHDVVNDVGIVRARAANNNLHFSKSEFVPPSSYINHYPMYDAGFTDFTVNHIRFVDTANLTWNVFGDTIPTLLPPGNTTGIRQGVVIEPQLNGLYVNWNVKSGKPDIYNSRRQQTAYSDNGLNVSYTVDSLDTVEFFGKNGVVCTLEGLFANQLRVMIDRRLSVQSSNNRQLIGDNTTRIEFKSFLGEDSIELYPFSSGDDSNLKDIRYSLSYFSNNINAGGSRFRTPVLPVTFTVNSSPGINEDDVRIVRGWYPKNVRRWASQWSKDYDNTNTDSYRILSNNPANQILPIGFWGWGSTANGETVYTPVAGSEWNMLCGDSQSAPWYNFRYADWQNAYPGGPKPIGLQIPWEDGIYFIQATVQGIMGINALAGQLLPVTSQAVHLHLVTDLDNNMGAGENFQGRVLQSLDIMHDYDYIPQTTQAQTAYLQAVNSRPWSMQGSGMFYLKQRERVFGLLTYNPGNGENRYYYQVCYVKMSCFKVASAADMKLGSITIDADADPTMYNYAPQRWHDMNFY